MGLGCFQLGNEEYVKSIEVLSFIHELTSRTRQYLDSRYGILSWSITSFAHWLVYACASVVRVGLLVRLCSGPPYL